MTDCGDLGNCAIPMWIQYAAVLLGLLLLIVKGTAKHDPYDRM